MQKIVMLASAKFPVKIAMLLLLVVVFGAVFSALSLLIGMAVWRNNIDSAGCMRFIQASSTIGMFAIPALIFSYLTTGNFFKYNNITKKSRKKSFFYVTILAFCILPIVGFLGYVNETIPLLKDVQWMQSMEIKVEQALKLLLNDNSLIILLLNILILGILPGICEELLFRGTLQPLICERSKNHHIAIWTTAIIFSIIHLQFSGFIPRLLLGAYLGYLFVWSGSLWLPIIAHVLHNTLTIVFNFITIRQDIDPQKIDPFTIPAFIPLLSIMLTITIIGIYRIWKQERKILA